MSHGYAAYYMGDNTAKAARRLTLNPLAHIDILGLACLLISQMFGWAKPVPVNFAIIARRRYGPIIVAAAGPVSNFALALISALLLMIFTVSVGREELFYKLNENVSIYVFIASSLVYSISINITLGIFNLIPILPLDGGRILQSLLPPDKAYAYGKVERWGFFIVLFLALTGIIGRFMFPIIKVIAMNIIKFASGGIIH
jgi:Zn-dependent protease